MPAYYDRKSRNFWLQTSTSGWTPVGHDDLRRHLIEHKISGRPGSAKDHPELSAVDLEINRIIREQQIDFACDVAGWKAGIHVMYGKRVLVQESPRLWTPSEGDWSFYEAALRAVSHETPIQYEVLKSWLMLGLIKIYTFNYRYSQILVMVGDVSSGKSLIHCMITVLVGGGVADPLEWMLGEKFNRDLLEAEHLCMEEPAVLPRDYQKYANKFKSLSVVEGKRCRGLYAEASALCPYQLVSVSTNTESDNTLVVPEFVRGIEDKMHALYLPSGSMPVKGYENLDQNAIRKLVEAQAPAFLWHLFNEYKIPPSLLTRVNHPPYDCQRFGMDAYHNPIVVDLVGERSEAQRFLMIFERLAGNGDKPSPFAGTVSKLSEWLVMHTNDPFALRLARSPERLGYILRGLAKKFPARVQKLKDTKKGVVWMLIPEGDAESN